MPNPSCSEHGANTMKRYLCTIVESCIYKIPVYAASEDIAKQEAEDAFTHCDNVDRFFHNVEERSVEYVELLADEDTPQ